MFEYFSIFMSLTTQGYVILRSWKPKFGVKTDYLCSIYVICQYIFGTDMYFNIILVSFTYFLQNEKPAAVPMK